MTPCYMVSMNKNQDSRMLEILRYVEVSREYIFEACSSLDSYLSPRIPFHSCI
jgi:hypothetical protein